MMHKKSKKSNSTKFKGNADDAGPKKTGSQIYPNATAQLDADEKLFDDEEYFWEKYAVLSISFFPHSPFCDAALLCFYENPMSDIANCYL